MALPGMTKCGLVVLALLLAGCGSGAGEDDPEEPADPLAAYVGQTLDWARCDDSFMQPWKELATLGERVQCVRMRAPLDYDNVDRGDIQVGILRVAAADPTRRRGVILFNPGGPGEDGLELAADFALKFAQGNPASTLGAALRRLGDEFDLIGFSPRGVGASTRQNCSSSALMRQIVFGADTFHTQNVPNALHNAGIIAQACERNPITPTLNTDATVRDMDLIRGLLGDAKMHYVGFSYGTWLGAWYARRFPDRADRFVLDSVVDLTKPLDNIGLLQPPAMQRIVDEYLAPYIASRPEDFNLGASARAVRSVVDGLSAAVRDYTGEAIIPLLYMRTDIDKKANLLGGVHGLDQVMQLYPQGTVQQIESALERHVFSPGNPVFDAQMRSYAQEAYRTLSAGFEAKEVSQALSVGEMMLSTVVCNDSPPRSLESWMERSQQVWERYPLARGGAYPDDPCIFWRGPRAQLPPWEPFSQRDVLLVQSEYDFATSIVGARASFAALPNAGMVYVPDEYRHGLFGAGNDCVDAAVAAYLLGEPIPLRERVCAPHPPRAGTALSQDPAVRAARQGPATYLDPERARELQERIGMLLVPEFLRKR